MYYPFQLEMLIDSGYNNKLELADYEETLAMYYDKNGQPDRQIQALYAKLQLFEQVYEKEHKNTLKLKRNIASILLKHKKPKESITILEEILVFIY